MAKKIMLWPSARSKFVKDGNMKLIYNTLLVLSVIMIGLNYYMFSFMYALKLALMIGVSILVTVEFEILFYTIDKDITRQESKKLIEKSYPKVTALMYALLIPVGTPLWLVALGAVLATLLGKLFFGGFHHMVFHSSLVGVIFVTLGWPGLVDGVAFSTSFDNYLIDLLFNNNFFNNTLAIGGLYDVSEYPNILVALQDMTYNDYSIVDVLLGTMPGIIGSGLVVLGMFGFLSYKKAINWITPVSMIGSFMVIALLFTVFNDYNIVYPIFEVFAGSFLFVAVFIASDPITTPMNDIAKVVFGVIAGSLTMLIRHAGEYTEGVYFAVGFMMMLTPMLNAFIPVKKKKPVPKKVVKSDE